MTSRQRPATNAVNVALRFEPPHVQAAWDRAVSRLPTDPGGAITAARSMVEASCKYILDKADVAYEDRWDLPALYKTTAAVLDISPSRESAPALRQTLSGCISVIEGVGALRSRLGDAHGKGERGVAAEPRHANL